MRADGVDVRLTVPEGPTPSGPAAPSTPASSPPALPSASPLPRTGVEIAAVLLVAVLLLVLGILLARAARRRTAC